MSNVWKVGSRWSHSGTKKSSIIDIFRKHQVVFIGNDDGRFKREVKRDDIIAIADGFSINTLAKVISEPASVTELNIEFSDGDKKRFYYHSSVIGVKVRIVELKDSIIYKKRTSFCSANKIAQEVHQKFQESFSRFEINASTKTISDLLGISDKSKITYTIPIYQRPYSWTKNHIDKLLSDLFIGYYSEGQRKMEDVFIGTMQLSYPKPIDKNLNLFQQDIIDGQQRISTFLVLIKLIQLKTDNQDIKNLDLKWLKTEVNNNAQQEYLDELINLKEIKDLKEDSSNTYIRNAFYVNQKLEEFFADEEVLNEISLENFLMDYVLKKVCFVVIETFAPLSKTLKIFDSINTTGLDLGGNDIFKIRFYEYLTNKKNEEKKVFEEISELYKTIDENNKGGWKFGIQDILLNYQWLIISKYNLNKTLFTYNSNTFFEQLFDVILNINNHNHFDQKQLNVKEINISIDELKKLIENRKKRDNEIYLSAEFACSYYLIFMSRYSKYWQLVMLFYYSFSDDNHFEKKLEKFVIELQKTLVVYSVGFDKAINDMHNFLRGLVETIIVDKDFEKIIKALNDKREACKSGYENTIKSDIFYNAKKKNLVCRTSAIIDEIKSNHSIEPENSVEKFFVKMIDIEHIHSVADTSNSQEKLKTWGVDLNSLGNLMVLEFDKNRSIGNKPFSEKIKKYDESNFSIVKSFAENNKDEKEWTKELAEKRKEEEVEKLINYYFNPEN